MTDKTAEEAVLGCLLNNGPTNYYSVADMLGTNTFSSASNGALYHVISKLYEQDAAVLDTPTIISTAKSEGLDGLISDSYVDDIRNRACHKSNIASLSAKIRKLQITRIIDEQMQSRCKDAKQVTGEESLTEILALAEIDFSELVIDKNEAKNLKREARAVVQHAAENPVDQIGISSGFPLMDKSIGGGLRPASITLLAARMKQGKSVVASNVAYNVAKMGLKVLYVDTEMRTNEQIFRVIARVSKVPIQEIETGKFAQKINKKMLVEKAIEEIEKIDLFHVNVAGMSFEEQMGIITRWIRTNIKQDLSGNWEKFLIIYDYIKLTSAKSGGGFAEYQALGFMTTSLHNLSVRYDFPIFALAQLNRDGIEKDSTDIIAGSDRIAQLVTSAIFLKPKSREEIDMDGEENGNKKFVVAMCRHGEGMEEGNYINMAMNGKIAFIKELNTRHDLLKQRNQGSRSTNQQ